jgi:hypothetical protein
MNKADEQSEKKTSEVAPEPVRFLWTREECARSLGISLRHFQRHVQPHLPCVYSGQLRLYRPDDLRRWVDASVVDPQMRRPR